MPHFCGGATRCESLVVCQVRTCRYMRCFVFPGRTHVLFSSFLLFLWWVPTTRADFRDHSIMTASWCSRVPLSCFTSAVVLFLEEVN